MKSRICRLKICIFDFNTFHTAIDLYIFSYGRLNYKFKHTHTYIYDDLDAESFPFPVIYHNESRWFICKNKTLRTSTLINTTSGNIKHDKPITNTTNIYDKGMCY